MSSALGCVGPTQAHLRLAHQGWGAICARARRIVLERLILGEMTPPLFMASLPIFGNLCQAH